MLPLAASSRTSTSSPHEVSRSGLAACPAQPLSLPCSTASGVSKGSSMHAKKPVYLCTLPYQCQAMRDEDPGSQAWLPYGGGFANKVDRQFLRLSLAKASWAPLLTAARPTPNRYEHKRQQSAQKTFWQGKHESDCRDQTYLEFISPSYTIPPHKG